MLVIGKACNGASRACLLQEISHKVIFIACDEAVRILFVGLIFQSIVTVLWEIRQ